MLPLCTPTNYVAVPPRGYQKAIRWQRVVEQRQWSDSSITPVFRDLRTLSSRQPRERIGLSANQPSSKDRISGRVQKATEAFICSFLGAEEVWSGEYWLTFSSISILTSICQTSDAVDAIRRENDASLKKTHLHVWSALNFITAAPMLKMRDAFEWWIGFDSRAVNTPTFATCTWLRTTHIDCIYGRREFFYWMQYEITWTTILERNSSSVERR